MRAAALWIGAALVLIALGARTEAQPAEAQPSEAERLYHDGQEAYDQQRYDAAIALWLRSYELSRLPALLFNLAQAYRLRGAAGDCARAVESYQRFIEHEPSAEQRATAETWLRELRTCAKTSPEDPARGSPEAGPAGATSAGRGAGKRRAGVIVAGGGVVVALVGVYFGNRARQLGDEVSQACAGGCLWSSVAAKDAEGRSAERTQWILYGVGAAGWIAGAALYYLGMRERTPAVAVAPREGGALLTWSRRW
ncbi:MAG TPA: hypothetical protein VN253_03055 [Kofleriaceae bacterium]|nr:hypothetical protein [Kofleriaceae bacterium]